MKKTIVLAVIMFVSLMSSSAQITINQPYKGYFISTLFEYTFYNEREFSIKTTGDFGNTFTKGHYSITNDTIHTKTNKTTSNTIGLEQIFLLDGDSCIIDLYSKYDFCNQKRFNNIVTQADKSKLCHISRARNISYPQIIPSEPKEKEDLVKLLNNALNHSSVIDFLDKHGLKSPKNIPLASYFVIKKDYEKLIKVSNHEVSILKEEKIKDKIYIKINHINWNVDDCSIEITIFTDGYKAHEDIFEIKDFFVEEGKTQGNNSIVSISDLEMEEIEEIPRTEAPYSKFFFSFNKKYGKWKNH